MNTVVMNENTCAASMPIRWERPACNLCGHDDPMLYHRERLAYFGRPVTFSIVKCRHCGLVYTCPRPADHNATYLAEEETNAAALEAHGRAKQKVFEQSLRRIMALQQHDPSAGAPKTLLDIGCGSGHFLHFAEQHGFKGVGIEPATGPAGYARRQFGLMVHHNDAANCHLPTQSFDVVTAWDVIEHVADPREMLACATAWLKPGGVMALRFPAGRWHKFKARVLHDFLHSDRPVFSPTMHYTFFDEDTFTTMAQSVGLTAPVFYTTAAEANTDSIMLNVLKLATDRGLRRLEGLLGRRMGNLEAYCRKE